MTAAELTAVLDRVLALPNLPDDVVNGARWYKRGAEGYTQAYRQVIALEMPRQAQRALAKKAKKEAEAREKALKRRKRRA